MSKFRGHHNRRLEITCPEPSEIYGTGIKFFYGFKNMYRIQILKIVKY